jgi:CRP-like cAMP-binding protein
MNEDKRENAFGNIKNILREIPFFEEFSSDELDFFSRKVSLRSFPATTVLFRRGDIGDYLFFVVEGMVDICLESADAKQKIIATFDRGSSVGEMSIVEDYPRSADIIVREPSELLILTRNRFESICQENPQIGIKFFRGIIKNLSLRLRKSTGRFADMA